MRGANARLQLLLENSKSKKGHNYIKTRNVTVCNKCPRRSLIMTLIPGCDLEHSKGTLTLGVGTLLLCVKHLVIMFYLSVKFR